MDTGPDLVSLNEKSTKNMNEDLKKALESEDDIGVVIRSHIVIESHMNNFNSFRQTKLEFSQTVHLAIGLGLDERFRPFLNTLGTLRNDFAHNLRDSLKKQDANNIIGIHLKGRLNPIL